jgi:Fe-S-cluster-containing hydrogenase component 2
MPILKPLQALQQGQWIKLICGASYQDLPLIRNLSLVYSLAGVHCIDGAADLAVIGSIRVGVEAAQTWLSQNDLTPQPCPWLMVSLNDGEDPHFRKAIFEPQLCPPQCPRPCESVCPPQAIATEGINAEKCYGCGRCLPLCPWGLITTESHIVAPQTVLPWLETGLVDALEIHTQVGHEQEFQRLWSKLAQGMASLKLLSISCPYQPGVLAYLQAIANIIAPLNCPLMWQTDGRPMSGDIGKGTTHTAIKFAQLLLGAKMRGFIQLAGGTNIHTRSKLAQLGLLATPTTMPTAPFINGIAYGSYARNLLQELLADPNPLEQDPPRLQAAIAAVAPLCNPCFC